MSTQLVTRAPVLKAGQPVNWTSADRTTIRWFSSVSPSDRWRAPQGALFFRPARAISARCRTEGTAWQGTAARS